MLLLKAMTQPMTGSQLATRVGMSEERVWEILRFLREHDYVVCLSPRRNASRVYWLSPHGSVLAAANVF